VQSGTLGELRRGARALGGGLEQPGAMTDVDHVGDHAAGVVAEDLSGETLNQAHVQ